MIAKQRFRNDGRWWVLYPVALMDETAKAWKVKPLSTHHGAAWIPKSLARLLVSEEGEMDVWLPPYFARKIAWLANRAPRA